MGCGSPPQPSSGEPRRESQPRIVVGTVQSVIGLDNQFRKNRFLPVVHLKGSAEALLCLMARAGNNLAAEHAR